MNFSQWATRINETVGPALWTWPNVYSRAIRDLVYLRSRESPRTLFVRLRCSRTTDFRQSGSCERENEGNDEKKGTSLTYQACRRNGRCQDRRDTSRRSGRDGTRTRSRLSRISAPWIPARSCRRTSQACSRKCRRARRAILEKTEKTTIKFSKQRQT